MDVEDDALAIGESAKNEAAVISVQQRRVLDIGADRQMKALDFTRNSWGYKLPDNKAVMLDKISKLPTSMATKREPPRLNQSRVFSRDFRLGVPGDGSLSLADAITQWDTNRRETHEAVRRVIELLRGAATP